MRCPFCRFEDTRVCDSRPTDDGNAIRRRRECPRCEKRFTTYEKVEETPLLVIKKDGRRVPFDGQRILKGLLTACEKRPVPLATLQSIVNEVEYQLRSGMEKEVPSRVIGEMVIERLKEIDEVAYVRFASVYRSFGDLEAFRREVEALLAASQKAAANGNARRRQATREPSNQGGR